MERSFNWHLMREACEDFNGKNFDYEGWIANHYNLMYVSGDDVGLLTYDYPGAYTGHWFYVSRGKQAYETAVSMLTKLFDETDAKAVRGITPMHLRGARRMAKLVGFEHIGIETWPDGEECEVMVLTKDAFNQRKKNG